jgi:hypothetical protein
MTDPDGRRADRYLYPERLTFPEPKAHNAQNDCTELECV